MYRTIQTIRAAALAAAIAGLAFGAGACAKRQTTSTDRALGGPVAGAPAGGAGDAGAGAGAAQPDATARTLPGGTGPAAMSPAGTGPGGGTTVSGPSGPASTTTYYGGVSPAGGGSGLADIFFGFDESTLSPEARQILDRNAEYLRRNPSLRVQIEGHADERGSTAYNLALGDRRATAARRYLESLGIDPSRLSTISYGEEKPFVRGSNEEAWAQNRRSHFVELR